MATTTPASQEALAKDPNFQARLFFLTIAESLVVLEEAPATPNHAARLAFANQVLKSAGITMPVMNVVVNSTNLVAATTSYDFEKRHFVTSATDGEIRSQIGSLWNTLAAIS